MGKLQVNENMEPLTNSSYILFGGLLSLMQWKLNWDFIPLTAFNNGFWIECLESIVMVAIGSAVSYFVRLFLKRKFGK